MPFFCTYDNVNVKMYISDEVLNQYKETTLYLMANTTTFSVERYDNAIILSDIDNKQFKIIIECMMNNFKFSTLYPYFHQTTSISKEALTPVIAFKPHTIRAKYTPQYGSTYIPYDNDTSFYLTHDILYIAIWLNKHNFSTTFIFDDVCNGAIIEDNNYSEKRKIFKKSDKNIVFIDIKLLKMTPIITRHERDIYKYSCYDAFIVKNIDT